MNNEETMKYKKQNEMNNEETMQYKKKEYSENEMQRKKQDYSESEIQYKKQNEMQYKKQYEMNNEETMQRKKKEYSENEMQREMQRKKQDYSENETKDEQNMKEKSHLLSDTSKVNIVVSNSKEDVYEFIKHVDEKINEFYVLVVDKPGDINALYKAASIVMRASAPSDLKDKITDRRHGATGWLIKAKRLKNGEFELEVVEYINSQFYRV